MITEVLTYINERNSLRIYSYKTDKNQFYIPIISLNDTELRVEISNSKPVVN